MSSDDVWIFTRTRFVSSTTQQKVDQVLADHNIDETKFRKIKQDYATCTSGLLGLLSGLLNIL